MIMINIIYRGTLVSEDTTDNTIYCTVELIKALRKLLRLYLYIPPLVTRFVIIYTTKL